MERNNYRQSSSPGGCEHENLMFELAKSLTRKEEKFRTQSKGEE
jgi:hypothetical protein